MQRIFLETLPQELSKRLGNYYILSGQDPLLIDEAKALIVQYARQAQFDEKIELNVANDTKWEELFEQVLSIGLFSQRQLIILNLPESINTTLQKKLAELVKLAHYDLLLIFHLSKLAKTTEKQEWFQYIEMQSVLINCQTPEISHLPRWIKQRAKLLNLDIEQEAIQLLSYNYESNLLALKQILLLLQLYFTNQKITLHRVKEVVEHSAQFSPFQWIDALLEGKIGRANRILHHLKNEEIQAVLLIRILQKELLLILEITRSPQFLSSNQPLFMGNLRAEFDRLKIWQNRRMLYQKMISRLTYRKLYLIFQQLAKLESEIKQEFSQSAWLRLEALSQFFI